MALTRFAPGSALPAEVYNAALDLVDTLRTQVGSFSTERAELMSRVEGLEAERDHYREELASMARAMLTGPDVEVRQRRIIAGLRRVVLVLMCEKRGQRGCGDMTEYSMYLSVRDRAWAILAAALNGEYRGTR